jgi:hypothetical protein
MKELTKEDIELAFAGVFILLQLLGPRIGLANDLTDEEKKMYTDRLDTIRQIVESSKYTDV